MACWLDLIVSALRASAGVRRGAVARHALLALRASAGMLVHAMPLCKAVGQPDFN